MYWLEIFWLHMTDTQTQTCFFVCFVLSKKKKKWGRRGHRKDLSGHENGKFQSMLVSGEA